MKYNKKKIKRVFNKVAKQAALKTVYQVQKDEHKSYKIVNYSNGEAILRDLPFLDISTQICNHLNNGKDFSKKKLNKIVDMYYKHYNDYRTYIFNIKSSNDEIRKKILKIRAELTYARMKKVRKEMINNYI